MLKLYRAISAILYYSLNTILFELFLKIEIFTPESQTSTISGSRDARHVKLPKTAPKVAQYVL